jgi:uncharacterized protein (TIGR02678 family)
MTTDPIPNTPHTSDEHTDAAQPRPRRRKAWSPDANATVSASARRLCRQPWAVAGRDDELIAIVRRHADTLTEIFGRVGWPLIVERDLVRLRKSPPPRRGWVPSTNPLTAPWFFLLVAGADSMPPKCSFGQLVTAGRAAAAEAGVETTGSITERRAIVAALRMLDARGVIEQIDGDLDQFLGSDDPPVLLAVHHTRLLHVIANTGPLDPAGDPIGWLTAVEREPDTARRMRRRLLDDTVLHTCDLDEAETSWLRQRLRGDDGQPLADAFGLIIERRAEGAAFVLPETLGHRPSDAGDVPFPTYGTVAHASLKLLEHALTDGTTPEPETTATLDSARMTSPASQRTDRVQVGEGWRALPTNEVYAWAHAAAAATTAGKGGWSGEYLENPDKLVLDVATVLTSLGLLRRDPSSEQWWFSPAAARWRLDDSARPAHRPAPAPSVTAELTSTLELDTGGEFR